MLAYAPTRLQLYVHRLRCNVYSRAYSKTARAYRFGSIHLVAKPNRLNWLRGWLVRLNAISVGVEGRGGSSAGGLPTTTAPAISAAATYLLHKPVSAPVDLLERSGVARKGARRGATGAMDESDRSNGSEYHDSSLHWWVPGRDVVETYISGPLRLFPREQGHGVGPRREDLLTAGVARAARLVD